MNKNFFQAARETDLAEKRRLDRRGQLLSWLRLTTFFLCLLALAAAWDTGALEIYLVAVALACCFTALLRRHGRLFEQRLLLESHIAALSNFLARFSGEWHNFPVTGAEYLRDELPQAQDLSLFGADSIYQYLCAARTKAGRDRLADALSPFPADLTLARKRQKAVEELIARPRLVLDLTAAAALLPDGHDTKPLLAALQRNTEKPYAGTAFIAWVLPAALALAVVGASLSLIGWTMPAMLVLLQFLIAFALGRRTAAAQKPLAAMHRELRLYERLFSRLEDATFQSPHLIALQAQLKAGGAARSLRRLAALADHAHTRHNLIFLLLANAFFLSDLHFAHRIAHWQEKAAAHLGDWLAVWAETEVLLSLSTVGLVREVYTFPELLEDASPRLEAKNLTHLLIPEEKAVPNDIDATASTRIITGSNMSGKTTYLRTVASACVLAYAGAPVPGERFRLSPLHIFTSIRVTDDAAHGLSTFYAEILRIKSMMAFKEKSLPMLIVIDEIFKGTNSADRLIGAREAISRLTGADFITLVSTHDFELCEIESDAAPVTNWHFEESYEDDKLLFDYKIKEGRCTTRNAQYLLKMAGIME
ncbi:MutS family DNA mismatch repair protein [Selenomonas sputigena]|uniref:MutS family DNA mismatch repair protein n=1 Tax=Selenomonas sputigena TaxID=69823 RepID=UPI0022342D36|nr:MutS family DNA mismatch repair protein [Selenomonas sputigena]UZE44570.1 MutS family DNA mismatch repair protein [Selenomonas sputigena]